MGILEIDDQKDARTLEDEGSLKSKFLESQNPCGQTPKEASLLRGISQTCNASLLGKDEEGRVNNDTIDENNTTLAGEISNVERTKEGENSLGGFENNRDSVEGEDVAEENEMTGGRGRELLVSCNQEANNSDGSQIEVALAVTENKAIGVGKNATEEAVEKTVNATPVHRSDSSRKIDGISLFVDVFGSLDGTFQVEDGKFSNENVIREGHSSENISCEINGNGDTRTGVSHIPDFMTDLINYGTIEEANELDNEVDEGAGNQEHNFIVGDLVWIKTKTNLWWPGVVSDPSNATKDAGSDKKGSLLVKYFGNANFVWCYQSHLKYFVQCFDEMVQQNNSRSFCGAVERAVNEIGKRVKEEMTCSCFSKSGAEFSAQTANGNPVSKQKIGGFCASSVSQFESAGFLAHVKCLARDGPLPGRIDLIVTQNRLSAFYQSLGHCQLPIYQLRPTDNKDISQSGPASEESGKLTEVSRGQSKILEKCSTEADLRQPISSSVMEAKENCSAEVDIGCGDVNLPGVADGSIMSCKIGKRRINGRSEKDNQTRERKKSKYLSYPYIDPRKDKAAPAPNGTENSEEVPDPGTDSNSKKGSRKSSGGHNAACKPEDLSLSSADMLAQLHLTALNSSYHKERRCSASIKRFFSCFRRFAFLNHEIAAEKDNDGSLEFVKKDNSAQKLPVAQSQMEGVSKSSEDARAKKKRRKKEAVTSASTVFPCTLMDAVNGSLVNEGQQLSTDVTQRKQVFRKRKNIGAVSGISDVEPKTQLPDTGANSTNSSFEGLQVRGNGASQVRHVSKKRKLKESPTKNGLGPLDLHGKCVKFVQLLKDVQNVGPHVEFLKDVQAAGHSLHTNIHEQNNIVAETQLAPESMTKQPEASVIPGQNNTVPETQLASETMVKQPEATANHVESGSLAQNLQQAQVFNPAANPEKKKRRRRKKIVNILDTEANSTIPDLNGNVGEFDSGGNTLNDVNSVSNNNQPQRRRRRSKSAAAVPDKVQNDMELSGAILLYFTAGVPLPSVESLLTMFVGHGALIESETRHLDDSSAQVVFLQSSDAVRAFRNLQEKNPFGAALAGYRLVYLSARRNSYIPDLNGNIAESGSLGNNATDVNSIPNKEKKPQRRRRRTKVQNNEELSGALLLNFAAGVALPSLESLLTTFVGYGPINESETRYLNDSSFQVVFVHTSDALQAFQRLQERNLFGPALAGYRFIYLPASASKPTNNFQMPQPCLPMKGNKTPAVPCGLNPKNGEPPDLLTIKQNLEMMKSMLERAGNNLSPEMRTKLETEIKGLMLKVNSTVGSSSSS